MAWRGRFLLYTAVLAVAASLGQGNDGSLPRKTPAVELTRSDAGHEARLWLLPERGVLHLTISPRGQSSPSPSASPLPMAKRADLWKPLLEQAFREQGRRADYLLTVGDYPDLNFRLALAAMSTSEWNRQTGQPRTGNAADAVKALLSPKGMLHEVDALFAPFDYGVSVHSVENVSIYSWQEIQALHPGETVTSGAELSPQARVPGGAAIVFKLTANPPKP